MNPDGIEPRYVCHAGDAGGASKTAHRDTFDGLFRSDDSVRLAPATFARRGVAVRRRAPFGEVRHRSRPAHSSLSTTSLSCLSAASSSPAWPGLASSTMLLM